MCISDVNYGSLNCLLAGSTLFYYVILFLLSKNLAGHDIKHRV